MTDHWPGNRRRPPLPRQDTTQPEVLARIQRRLASWRPGAASSQDTSLRGLPGPPPPKAPSSPLSRLVPLSISQGPLAENDFSQGLLDAWAALADVLTFYQERIAPESYLLTATEDFSVQELVRTVGVTPLPAVTARVDLCFTVSDKRGAPEELVLPQGLAVQSLPAPGGLPQTYETSAELLTRAEWSSMALGQPGDSLLTAPATALRADAPALLLQDGRHGVRAGDTLLVRAKRADGSEWLGLPTVTRVASTRQRGLLAWDLPLDKTLGSELLTSPQVWGCRPPEPLLGHDATPWEKLSLEERLAAGGTPVGGLQRLSAPDSPWKGLGAAPGKVHCLLADPDDGIFAGMEGKGLQCSQDDGATWTPVKALARMEVLCLGYDAQGRLVAGTQKHGVQRSADGGESWESLAGRTVVEPSQLPLAKSSLKDLRLPPTPVRCVAGFLFGNGADTAAFLLAGTDEGLFSWDESAGVWSPINDGLPLAKKGGRTPITIRAIVTDEANQRFLIGTSQGLFTTTSIGTEWTANDPGLPGQPVAALVKDARGTLFAALEGGGLYSAADTKKLAWVPVAPKTASGVAEASALLPLESSAKGPPGLLAVLSEGLFVSRDSGTTWAQLPTTGTSTVWAVAEASPNVLLAATPVEGVKEKEWPGWALTSGELVLARALPRLLTGQTLVLEQPAPKGPPRRALVTAKQVLTEQVKAFGQRHLVTRLQVEPEEVVTGFDRALVRVRACPTALPLREQQVREPTLLGPEVDLETLLGNDDLFAALVDAPQASRAPPREDVVVAGAVELPPGRTVMVVGRRLRVLVGLGTALELVPEERHDLPLKLEAGQVLEVMAWPAGTEGAPPVWRLRDEHGATGTVKAAEGKLLLLPAAKDGEQVALRRQVVATAPERGATRLVLDKALEEMLDPDTVAVRGNVVEATHGTTVKEVLGSGDARRPHQQFRLKRSPLVWRATADGPVPAVDVWVEGQRWQRVEDWSGQKQHSRVYVLRTDADGNVWVCFGDGVHGARLPTGAENVVAVYRTGGGPAGNVGAGRITLLRHRLLGLRTVDNPLPATGGTAAQAPSELRTQAPLQLRTLGRIVSLGDFADYVRTYPGVARVRVRKLWNGHQHLLSFTVATTEEDTGHRMGASLQQALRQELERFRPKHYTLQVDSFVPRPFLVEATLTVDPDFDADAVKKSAAQALVDAFAFEQRELAQPVATSDILRLLSGVRGVLNARVTSLRLSGTTATPGSVPTVLPAADSVWGVRAQKVLPAELLLLDEAGPTLTVEKATS
ncbi:putative baseplate assembly protein [Archangium violaceum]|uniref:putative baseplate assembly protein n=1 Tax=Archangium violaceum TaxID=83451 RepID=UPI00193C41F4|nr:putative baseplate assembly protein [Archangium violaceum]QRK06077.1 putative baseplate assembly protein [Archangium violaceum]